MDYQTQRAMSTLQDLLRVGQQHDLSHKYVNNGGERLAGSHLTRLFASPPSATETVPALAAHMTNTNGNHRSISSEGGSEVDDDDCDSRSDDNVALSDGEGTQHQIIEKTSMLPDKVKLNFSVDSILSGEIERRNERKRHIVDEKFWPAYTAPPKCVRLNGNAMYSAAEAIELNSPVYRPMPLRFLETKPPGKFTQFHSFGNTKQSSMIFGWNSIETSTYFPTKIKKQHTKGLECLCHSGIPLFFCVFLYTRQTNHTRSHVNKTTETLSITLFLIIHMLLF